MTPAQINKRREQIEKHLKRWQAGLGGLQDMCPHFNATHKNGANTGNWDRSDDCYWTDHVCPDCGKHWTTDQDWDRK
jgi:hypothetical protein